MRYDPKAVPFYEQRRGDGPVSKWARGRARLLRITALREELRNATDTDTARRRANELYRAEYAAGLTPTVLLDAGVDDSPGRA